MSVPSHALLVGADGAFYGTAAGGTNSIGEVFKVSAKGAISSFASFIFPEGHNPVSLTPDPGGNLFGITFDGGTLGGGTAFRIAPDGTVTTLVQFGPGEPTGIHPSYNLTRATDASYYGVTQDDGSGTGKGSVFRLSTDGSLTTVASPPSLSPGIGR